MQHLDTERIAAFDHDAPSDDELAHLAACTVCRTERNAFSALNQRSMHLADTPVFPAAPPLTTWESLSARLRAEGLIAGDAPGETSPLTDAATTASELRFESVMRALNAQPAVVARNEQPLTSDSWWQRVKPRSASEFLRIAAAILFVGISGAGLNQVSNARAAAEPSADAQSTADLLGPLGIGRTGYSSVDEATKALARTEREFDRISTWITTNDPSASKSDVLRKRLAALDRIMATAYTEMQTSPNDRVLAHHFRSAAAARELTLKQLGGALPVDRSLERF